MQHTRIFGYIIIFFLSRSLHSMEFLEKLWEKPDQPQQPALTVPLENALKNLDTFLRQKDRDCTFNTNNENLLHCAAKNRLCPSLLCLLANDAAQTKRKNTPRNVPELVFFEQYEDQEEELIGLLAALQQAYSADQSLNYETITIEKFSNLLSFLALIDPNDLSAVKLTPLEYLMQDCTNDNDDEIFSATKALIKAGAKIRSDHIDHATNKDLIETTLLLIIAHHEQPAP